jgi:hypothetical protein
MAFSARKLRGLLPQWWSTQPLTRFCRWLAVGLLGTIWTFVFLWTLTAILAKSALYVVANGAAGLHLPVIAFVILYAVFVLEGAQTAVIQIQNLDPQVWDEFFEDQGVTGHFRKTMLSVFRSLFPDHDSTATTVGDRIPEFLVGRQILTILSVVSFAFILAALKVENPFSYSPLNHIGADWVGIVDFALFSPTAQFLTATLFQAWVSQLLPKILAKDRSIQMLRVPGAPLATRLCVKIGRLRAGAPVLLLQNLIQKFDFFTTQETIPIGGTRYFNQLVDRYGFYIDQRELTLKIARDRITVSDKSLYHFEDRQSDMVSFFTKIVQPKAFRLELDKIEVLLNAANRKGAQQTAEIGKRNRLAFTVQVYDSGSASVPDQARAPVDTAEVIIGEHSIRRFLNAAAERNKDAAGAIDAIWSNATYTLTPTDAAILLQDDGIRFSIEIGRPTRGLTIVLDSEVYILGDFEISASVSEAGITLVDDEIDLKNMVKETISDRKSQCVITFPPMGAALQISFNLATPA